MKTTAALLFTIMIVGQLFGQKSTIRGAIHDEDGNAVPYVNVFLSGTVDGTMGDTEGRFSFATRRSGDFELTASSVGFLKFTKMLRSGVEDTVITISIIMVPAVITSEEIVVTASSYASEKGKGVVVSSMDVLLTPGGAGDIYQSLKTLPGVTQVSESAQLYVRGGDPTETVTLVDQASMYNPYTLESAYGGLFSNLNTNAVKSMFFSSGGFSAKYGNVLSGVLDIETKDEPAMMRTSFMVALHGSEGNIELPIVEKVVGLRLDVRQSYTRPIFAVNGGLERFAATPTGRDLSGNIVYKYSKTGRIKFAGLYAEDTQSVNVERAEYHGVFNGNSSNRLVNLQIKDILFSSLLLKASTSYNRYRNYWELGILDIARIDDALKVRIDAEQQVSTRTRFSFGIEAEDRSSSFRGIIPLRFYDFRSTASGIEIDNVAKGIRSGAYAEIEMSRFLGNENLAITVGLRRDHVSPIQQSWLDPRASLGYRLGESSVVKFGWGIFRQLPDVRLFGSTDGNPNLKAMKATHYIVGYDQKLDENIDLRFELFEKTYTNLPLEDAVINYDNGGYGFARGVDLLAKGSLGPLSGWLSYGYINTQRKWMEFQSLAPSNFDITNSVAIVAKYAITTALQVGVNYKYATGRPYTPFVSARFDPQSGVFEPLYGNINSSRYPDYKRMDLRVTYLTRLFDQLFTVLFVETLNVMNTNNVFGYSYSQDYADRVDIKSYFGRRMVVMGMQLTF